jgi:hypothetical protein
MTLKLEHKDVWTFKYREIYCEIVHWGVDYVNEGLGIWNSYIYLFKKNIPDFDKLLCKKKKGSIISRYYWESYKLDKFFNFHCGISFYELLRDEFNGKIVGVKIGCDYSHLWDNYKQYDETQLKNDLIDVVDNFYLNFPKSGIEMLEDLANENSDLLKEIK